MSSEEVTIEVVPTTSSRLLALLSLLQARRDWPGGLLAERLEVSARTVRRDIDRLRALGYPIAASKGRDGGYRLEAGTELPPLLFDDGQAVALTIALQLATTAGAGIEEDALRALGTVRQVMPSRLRHRIRALEVTPLSPVSDRPDPPVDTGVLEAIGASIFACEVLRFDYRSGASEDPRPPRRVEPHHLVSWGRRWYLVAWDLDREDWRTFRVDRLQPRTLTGPRFARRELPGGGDLQAFVSSRFRGSTDGSGHWPCEGEVVVHRPVDDIAPYVRDGVVEALTPTTTRLVCGAWSWMGLAASISRLDADVDVVGPTELTQAFAQLARRSARTAATPEPA